MSLSKSLSPLTIIGASGRMGSFFGELFLSAGLEVFSIDIDTPKEESDKLLSNSKVVVVSVPISVTCQVLSQVMPILPSDSLLVDLTSVKEMPMQLMKQHKGEVLGLHPMFAPNQQGLLNQTVVVCKERQGQRAEVFLELLKAQGAKLEFLSATKHDQLMAVVQGLNHFHSIVFAHAFAELGVSVPETISVASPIYKLRMQLMGRILAQDPNLYAEMELHNPYVIPALKSLQASAEKFFTAIESGSSEQCIQFFKQAADNFGSYRNQALSESNLVLSKINALLSNEKR